jgi:deoxyribose-phosphate aldolase
MVLFVGALKAGETDEVRRDIEAVVDACCASKALCKVIIEACLLNHEEKIRACEISADAGADFVKTSTGFAGGGATVEDVALMARTVASRGLCVKAAGGIRTCADAVAMIAAGATRIGASSSVRIIEEARSALPEK